MGKKKKTSNSAKNSRVVEWNRVESSRVESKSQPKGKRRNDGAARKDARAGRRVGMFVCSAVGSFCGMRIQLIPFGRGFGEGQEWSRWGGIPSYSLSLRRPVRYGQKVRCWERGRGWEGVGWQEVKKWSRCQGYGCEPLCVCVCVYSARSQRTVVMKSLRDFFSLDRKSVV